MAEATTARARLRKARAAMKDPRLTGENPHFGSKFVPRDSVLDAVVQPLLDNGLTLTQGIFDGELVTTVHGDDDALMLGCYPVAANADPQKYMAALTYASRGSLMLAFALAGDADDDGNEAAKKPEPTPAPEPVKSQVTVKHDPDVGAYETLMTTAGLKETKAAVGDFLGNPKTKPAGLKAYKALSEEKRVEVERIAEGVS